jgi:hypothetical protein
MQVCSVGALIMPIRPLLAGRAFEPEMITEMSDALERTCKTLGFRMVDDAMSRIVAAKIIELSQRGVRGTKRLQAMAVEELRAPLS